jgi:hypothetical protein
MQLEVVSCRNAVAENHAVAENYCIACNLHAVNTSNANDATNQTIFHDVQKNFKDIWHLLAEQQHQRHSTLCQIPAMPSLCNTAVLSKSAAPLTVAYQPRPAWGPGPAKSLA